MTENNVDPGQAEGPDQRDRQQARATKRWSGEPVHLTPLRVVSGILVLTLLLVSAGSVLAIGNSYASTSGLVAALTPGTAASTCTATPTVTSTTAPGTLPGGKTPTPHPTATIQSTLTPTPTTTPIPTATPTPTPSETGDRITQKFSVIVQCSTLPTATAPAASTPATAPMTTSGNSGRATPDLLGGLTRMAVRIGTALLGLLLCLGIGWGRF